MSGFWFRLTYPDGRDAGSFHTGVPSWRVGDTFCTADERQLRIRAMFPLDLVEPLSGGPVVAVWEVEPT